MRVPTWVWVPLVIIAGVAAGLFVVHTLRYRDCDHNVGLFEGPPVSQCSFYNRPYNER